MAALDFKPGVIVLFARNQVLQQRLNRRLRQLAELHFVHHVFSLPICPGLGSGGVCRSVLAGDRGPQFGFCPIFIQVFQKIIKVNPTFADVYYHEYPRRQECIWE